MHSLVCIPSFFRITWQIIEATDYVQCQFLLSQSYPHEPQEGMRWLTLAAENGQVNAQHNLGMHYLKRDARLAYQWFSRAAAQGSVIAEQRLRSNVFKDFP